MKTKITELFGIEHPIIQGGMHHVGFAELAAAVSNAGGLGTITGLTQGTPEKLANEIARCKEMTDKPFAVNLTFLPSLTPPDYPGLVDVIIGGGVPIVETAGRNPAEYLPALKEAGIKVIHKCTSVRHSLKAQSIGCDAVSVDGFECGGHPGEDDIPNFILRFIATQEAPVHQNVKDSIVNASELDTRLIMRSLRNTERVLNNEAVERLMEKEAALGDQLTFQDIADEVAGVYPKIMHEGTMEVGAWSCGMVAGLVNDIPTVKELIDGIMNEADAIIGKRLSNF